MLNTTFNKGTGKPCYYLTLMSIFRFPDYLKNSGILKAVVLESGKMYLASVTKKYLFNLHSLHFYSHYGTDLSFIHLFLV